MSKGFMSFDDEKPEKFVILPAGRGVCLMCERTSKKGEVVKITKRFKVRLCPKCYREYELTVGKWREVALFKKL